jgi:periplasmic protein TonB
MTTNTDTRRPDLFGSATELSQPVSWFDMRFGTPRLLSVGIHAALVGLALIPWAATLPARPAVKETSIVLNLPENIVSVPVQLPARMQGGGGGGKHELTPASRGVLPRAADKQVAPPDPEPPKNPDPSLIVEPTIVAPQLATLRPINLLNIGDPNGIAAPPSSGTGTGGGIGDGGKGHGVGSGNGPGTGTGDGGGCCDGTYHVGGGVTSPTVLSRVEPEYSEEARKARYEGTVLLEAIIRKDGRIDTIRLLRSLGFGLDQNAIDALKKWRFHPGLKDGKPVDVMLNIAVSFNLR